MILICIIVTHVVPILLARTRQISNVSEEGSVGNVLEHAPLELG